MLQGLALGGEYGGAATYVAEHAPHGKRGAYTSWIQTTATLGLFLSLMVILGVRTLRGRSRPSTTGAGAFRSWCRSCCWASRSGSGLSLNESPAFQKMKAEGKTSKAPLSESFGEWKNLQDRDPGAGRPDRRPGRGLVHGPVLRAVLPDRSSSRSTPTTANLLIAASLLLGTPFFIVFGTLSDKIGRKPIIMAGCLLAALTYFPVFKALTEAANPDLAAAQANDQA